MKVNLAKSAGFCFGVKRALDIAFKTISSEKNVCMLGDIVHNEEIIEEIKKAGIKKIKALGDGKNKSLLIRAHGTGLKIINRAIKLGYNIVDATCPMVKEIHSIARDMESKGRVVIIIGDKNHDEVRGIIGQLKKRPLVIDTLKNIPRKKFNKVAVVVQSTQNTEKVMRIVEALKARVRSLEFFNTICRPTRLKQEDLNLMPLENDVMIIIGSKGSANTKRLYEISKALNKRSYWVHTKKDLKRRWFKQAETIGITAGASTPNRTIKETVEYIKKLG